MAKQLTYMVNFNFGAGFDDKPDVLVRDFDANVLRVTNGADGKGLEYKMNDAAHMQAFYQRLALVGTQTVYPAQFTPCPVHGGADDKTLAFELPKAVYEQLAAKAKAANGDFNGDRFPDVGYVNPQVPDKGYVHIEPKPEVLQFGQMRKQK